MNRFEPELIAVMKDVLEQVAKEIHPDPSTQALMAERIKKAEGDAGKRAGVTTDMAARLKALERENRELRQANEILRKASAYFAMAELDGRSKTAAATLVWSARAVVAEGETTTV